MQRAIVNISVPPKLRKQIELLALSENRTKSELLREAFRVYIFNKNWAKIRAWGEETARKLKVETYDDIEKIAG